MAADHTYGFTKTYFWVGGILTLSCSIMGFVGNCCTLIFVCNRHTRRKLFYNLLFALACFDNVCIASFGMRLAYESLSVEPVLTLVKDIFNIFEDIGLVGSIYMTMSISFERYLGICHPEVKWRRNAWVYLVPVIAISVGISIPEVLNLRFYFLREDIFLAHDFLLDPVVFILVLEDNVIFLGNRSTGIQAKHDILWRLSVHVSLLMLHS